MLSESFFYLKITSLNLINFFFIFDIIIIAQLSLNMFDFKFKIFLYESVSRK